MIYLGIDQRQRIFMGMTCGNMLEPYSFLSKWSHVLWNLVLRLHEPCSYLGTYGWNLSQNRVGDVVGCWTKNKQEGDTLGFFAKDKQEGGALGCLAKDKKEGDVFIYLARRRENSNKLFKKLRLLQNDQWIHHR